MSTCGRSAGLCTAVRGYAGDDGGPRPQRGTGASAQLREPDGGQRQRIDITRPATMRPNPMAKFHTPSVVRKPILSPAT